MRQNIIFYEIQTISSQGFCNQWNTDECNCYDSNCYVDVIKFLNEVSRDSQGLISSPGGVIVTFQWTVFTTPAPAKKLSITKSINFRRAEILEDCLNEWNINNISLPHSYYLLVHPSRTFLFFCSHDAHQIHLQMERHSFYQPQVPLYLECKHSISSLVHWKYYDNILILLTLF